MEKKGGLPNHVAIIPDGNRRWARSRGLKPWEGHEAGAENTEKLVRQAFNLGIKCLSFWGSSMDNLKKRPLNEKRALLNIYEKYFKKLVDSDDIHNNEARINFIGRWEEQFPESLKKIIRECKKRTQTYKNYFLNFFLAYNGDDEMMEAIKKIVEKHDPSQKITAQTIKENLMTKDLPPVDFLIRTGGEPHLSAGFMMWDIANAQLYFSEKYYPDFNTQELAEAIKDFQNRGRRHGK